VTIKQPTPAAPVLSSPGDASTETNGTPAFNWDSAANGATYQIQVDDNANFSSPELDDTDVTTSRTPGAPLADGVYSWRVRAINVYGTPGEWSAVWMLTVDMPPTAPAPLTPANAATETTGTPSFSWDSVANGATYQIQVDDNADFNSPELDDTADTTSRTPGAALADGAYSWRVRAINALGTPGEWSATQTLTISVPPAVPTLSSPGDASTETTSTPTFIWESVVTGVTYQIQVDTDADFSSPELDDTSATTSRIPGTPLANGTYYWRVRAINALGLPGEWSGIWTVTVTVP
jgi:predicted phage tail protein